MSVLFAFKHCIKSFRYADLYMLFYKEQLGGVLGGNLAFMSFQKKINK